MACYSCYYVKNKKPNDKVVIVSSDEDLTQLINETVCIYNPRLKKFISDKNFKEIKGFIHENVVIKKIFCGDTSDNIGNIDGVSENRLFELMPELKERPVTINEIKERAQEKINERINNKKKPLKWHENIINGVSKKRYNGDFYEINKKIIDLSEPLLTDNAKAEMDSMMYAPMDPEGRSIGNLYQYILDDNITDLIDNDKFSSFFYYLSYQSLHKLILALNLYKSNKKRHPQRMSLFIKNCIFSNIYRILFQIAFQQPDWNFFK